MKKFLPLILFLIPTARLLAQAVTLDPEFPAITEPVTITFDVTEATDPRAEGLLGLTEGVFLWSGAGTGGDPFEFQPDEQTDFSAAFAPGRMTFLGNDRWSITLTIKEYFSIPDGVEITQLGLLLKNEDGSAQTEDFIVDIVAPSLDAITLDPPEPNLNDTLTIRVDLTEATDPRAEDLLGADSDIFLWSGIGDTSNPFKYGPPGQTSFFSPFPPGEMTPAGNDMWEITIVLNDYFDIPFGAEVNRMGFLIKNGNGSAQTEDFVVTIEPGGNFISFISPQKTDQVQFVEAGADFTITAGASASGDLMMEIDSGDGFKMVAETMDTDSVSFDYTVDTTESIIVKITATIDNVTISKEREIDFFVRKATVAAALPAGVQAGVNFDPDNDSTVTLALIAPDKEFVFVVGEFTNWALDDAFLMNYDADANAFWLEINGLTPGKEYIYQYWVEGVIKVGDPFADKVADPANDSEIPNSVFPDLIQYVDSLGNGIATTLQTGQEPFEWAATEDTWVRPNKEDLVIYELLVRDFIGSHDYKDLEDTLSYLKRLGVNAIELMPIMEFEANISWGYNPSYLFAPDKYYGREDDLRRFIQTAHQEGFAVILDMVLNHHFGQSPLVQMYFENGMPTENNPWFNQEARHPFNVGFDFNHESEFTKSYVDSVNSYWLREFHFDGFRFDLSKGFTQTMSTGDEVFRLFDQSRVDILTRMANNIWAVDPTAYVILEHFAETSEETELAARGMLLWGNFNFDFRDLLSGQNVNKNLSGLTRLSHVNYMESHDEERLIYATKENGRSEDTYDISELSTGLDRSKLGAAFFFTLPGAKMMWQFQELGYDIDIEFNGRTGEKPQVWGDGSLNYYTDPDRRKLYDTYSAIINLTHDFEEVFANNSSEFNLSGSTKSIRYEAEAMDLIIVGNFDLTENDITPGFTKTGTWYGFLTGDSINVMETSQTMALQPGEFHILTDVKLEKPGDNLVPWALEFSEVTAAGDLPEDLPVTIYPNPGGQFLQISGLKRVDEWVLGLNSMAGSEVPVRYEWISKEEIRLSTQNLEKGLYILTFTDRNKHAFTQKLLIYK